MTDDCEHAAWCQILEAYLWSAHSILTSEITKTHRDAQQNVIEYQSYTRYDAIDEREIIKRRTTPRKDL